MTILLSNILLVITWLVLLSGLFGMFKYKTAWARTLTVAKLDSIVVSTLVLAMIFRTGWSYFLPKLLVLLVFYWLTNPVANQLIALSLKKATQQKGGL